MSDISRVAHWSKLEPQTKFDAIGKTNFLKWNETYFHMEYATKITNWHINSEYPFRGLLSTSRQIQLFYNMRNQ